MDGMDMDMFVTENQYRAKILWYLIAAWVGLLTILRFFGPSSKGYMATATAIYREFAYPQPIWFTGRFSKYFTPPPIGRIALLACYWIVILVLLWSDVLMEPTDPMYPYKWEKVGFRAAWISVTQIPFIFLLSCKFNPISLLTGISYERFNWLHRWVSRTVFITTIVHWSYFFTEWTLADFVQWEFKTMPMIKYGFGAFAVLGWTLLSGSFRSVSYEIFVLQHIAAAAVLLWLLCIHVPSYAMYNIWLSVGFVAFDWSFRLLLALVRNIHFGKPGYLARLENVGDLTRLTADVGFTWKPGQHIYLSIPAVRPFELHPFTIADSSKLTLLIQARSGFTKSLREGQHRVFLHGPFGMPPTITQETVVLIACSTGVSFTLPILQDLLKRGTRRIFFHWIVRKQEHLTWVSDALDVANVATRNGVALSICTHTTDLTQASISSASSLSTDKDEKTLMQVSSVASGSSTSQSYGRPQLDSMIRPAVESALGETAIIACGGLAFTAELRTYVALLSDERAVHKGTGAQGIFLFTETYGW